MPNSFVFFNAASSLFGASLPWHFPKKKRFVKISGKVSAAATVTKTPMEEIKEYTLPSWAMFELGRAPASWKTMNGLPPTSLQANLFQMKNLGLLLMVTSLLPLLRMGRLLTNTVNLIFSFTNGVDWGAPCRLQFQVPKAWQNRAIEFFNQGLADELNKGACDMAIFPDTFIVVDRCAMIGNLFSRSK
ncbi:hypothetical protein CRYUN_Cryun31cG0101100 [Craigia yunnanensis]